MGEKELDEKFKLLENENKELKSKIVFLQSLLSQIGKHSLISDSLLVRQKYVKKV